MVFPLTVYCWPDMIKLEVKNKTIALTSISFTIFTLLQKQDMLNVFKVWIKDNYGSFLILCSLFISPLFGTYYEWNYRILKVLLFTPPTMVLLHVIFIAICYLVKSDSKPSNNMWSLACIAALILDILLFIINMFSNSSSSGTYLLFNVILCVIDFFWLSY